MNPLSTNFMNWALAQTVVGRVSHLNIGRAEPVRQQLKLSLAHESLNFLFLGPADPLSNKAYFCINNLILAIKLIS